MKNLSDFVEQISDDFQSTFSVIDKNTLSNMMGFPNDFENLTNIIHKYLPDSKIEFVKTNEINDPYDVYLVRAVNENN